MRRVRERNRRHARGLPLALCMALGGYGLGCERGAKNEAEPDVEARGDGAVSEATKPTPPASSETPTAAPATGGGQGAEEPSQDTGTAVPEAATVANDEDAREQAPGEASAEAGADEPRAPSPAALLARARSTKTTDAAALAALADAQAAGAKPRQLAQAANARGEALYGTPARATKFFTWAAEKDPKYPEPVFNLAKQAATVGDVDETVKHLTEVERRGGKKLLAQIEFDPMWEIVKDDPDVQALLK